MSALPDTSHSHLSEEDYLTLERQSEARHEFVQGELIAMAGAGRAHNLICTNITRQLGNQLAGQPCEIYQSDMRIQVHEAGTYRYPDVIVVCGEPKFADAELDTLLNPTVLIEVLSTATAATDRGIKLWEYRQLPSLQEYLLIAQQEPRIERFLRQKNDEWLLSDTVGLETTLALPSIHCALTLADIYDKVSFDHPDENAS